MATTTLIKTISGSWDHSKNTILQNFQKVEKALNGIPQTPTFIEPRHTYVHSSNSPAINVDETDIFSITHLDTDILSFTANLQGTPTAGQQLLIRIKDDGTARAITWGDKFADAGATLPTTTHISEFLYVHLVWNEATEVWDCIGAGDTTTATSVLAHHTTHETGGSDAITSLDASVIDSGTLDPTRLGVQVLPTGVIFCYAGSSAPTGWLLCDGSAVSRATYATLFAIIGTAYGSGDGSTTFNLPDFQGRSPMGAGTGSGLTARTLGTQVGEESHALTTSEMPVHNHTVTDSGHSHTINDPGHTHNIYDWNGGAGLTVTHFQTNINNTSDANGRANAVASSNTTGINGTNSHTTGISIDNAGSGSSHNNVQPNTVVNFIIKT